MIWQVPVCRLNSCPTRRTSTSSASTYAGRALTSRPLAAPVPRRLSLFRSALLMYECCLYPAKSAVAFYRKGTNSARCSLSGSPVLRAARHQALDGTWQTLGSVRAARRRRGDVSDSLDGLAHRVATLLPKPLLPFHVGCLTQAPQRLPPASMCKCIRPQSPQSGTRCSASRPQGYWSRSRGSYIWCSFCGRINN